jgi:pimeloyl-ACP methyl ester carboxylesterase
LAPVLDPLPVPVGLRTLHWGHGRARALLVHGVQSAANTWWQIADRLAENGFHVIAPDLRGHGRSPSARRYRLADFVADLRGLGDDWDLAVGHSLGGTLVAYALATSSRFARHAVLLEPVFKLPEDDFEAIISDQLAELAAESGAFAASNTAWHPEDCRLKALAAAACSPHVNEGVLRENRPWSYAELLATVQTPVLVLGGDPAAGAMLEPALGDALASANPNVHYEQLDGAGHSLHRDRPEFVAEALLRTVDSANVR